ncbi:MAG: tetratricopeptide repeat protein [Deltaproteobacteria bacterium]|nr:tetratricopeptide repeat protein [Deltaproteobacteria bacterium]
MIDVDEALEAVQKAALTGDPEQLDAARRAYLEVDGKGAVAADMRYRLGLSRLFQHRDADGAIELFKEAASEKGAPVAPEARVSLALCLSTKGKRQQAIFELRKMLPEGAAPTIHTAQALDFLSVLLRDSGAQQKEIIAVDEQRKQHLLSLAMASKEGEKAHYLLRLAAAHVDAGTGPELALARKRYDEVIKMGPVAGDSAVQAARQAQKSLPR